MVSSTRHWLQQWFFDHVGVSAAQFNDDVSTNYFEKGWIDSFQFIQLLTDIEQTFSIHFDNDEFQDRSFATAKGLVEIIDKKRPPVDATS